MHFSFSLQGKFQSRRSRNAKIEFKLLYSFIAESSENNWLLSFCGILKYIGANCGRSKSGLTL
jgi:hypothetical protein